ncbi:MULTISPECIES: hypothetical protein [unclassified Mesorhizobium]|uniref:hypothetical protein n=1 Tax=unclassified Mesorhizobium TaxID=325217 RepID=UPI0012EB39F4|nr:MULTISPECIES: hypothetical protein [unclassified Mesorhizobium]
MFVVSPTLRHHAAAPLGTTPSCWRADARQLRAAALHQTALGNKSRPALKVPIGPAVRMECAGHPFTLEFFECDGDTLYRVKIICSRIVEQKTEVRGRYKRDSKFLCPPNDGGALLAKGPPRFNPMIVIDAG